MPIYVYKCSNVECAHEFEVIVLSVRQQHPVMACPECGAKDTNRQITAAAWQWGSGPKESSISKGIKRVKQAEREGKLD